MDEVDDIARLDSELDLFDSEMLAALVVLNGRVVAETMSLIDGLELHGRATTSAEMQSNLRAVTMWRADLPDLLGRVGLTDLVNRLSVKLKSTVVRLNAYYTAADVGFSVVRHSGGYATAVGTLVEQTKRLLLNASIDTYGPILDEVLNWHVLTKATGAQMRTALLAKLPIEGAGAVRHVSQVSSDALYTFSRGYSQMVAEGLNLGHYYYMGSETTLTRGFCHSRIGKAYTQKEVEQWAEESWSGKIPGTTKQSIFWYCGGYNCKHRLLPISKNTYSIFTNNNEANGKEIRRAAAQRQGND